MQAPVGGNCQRCPSRDTRPRARCGLGRRRARSMSRSSPKRKIVRMFSRRTRRRGKLGGTPVGLYLLCSIGTTASCRRRGADHARGECPCDTRAGLPLEHPAHSCTPAVLGKDVNPREGRGRREQKSARSHRLTSVLPLGTICAACECAQSAPDRRQALSLPMMSSRKRVWRGRTAQSAFSRCLKPRVDYLQ